VDRPAGGRVQTRLALRYLDQLLQAKVHLTFAEWVGQRRDAGRQWYRIAAELSDLTTVDISPETVRRWYENPLA
jgi:hypothetical protein